MVLVRPAVPGDFEAWLPLWDGYNAFYGRTGETALAAEVTADRWMAFMSRDHQMWALVAESEGRLIGIAHYLFHPSTSALAPACYLQDLFTREAERGRGVASALIEAVSAKAAEAGSTSVYWQTHRANSSARRLYDRLAAQSDFIIYRRALA